MKGIKSTILLLIPAVLIIKNHLETEECTGMLPLGMLWMAILYLTAIVLIILIIYRSLDHYSKTKNKTGLISVFAVICLTLTIMAVVVRNHIRDNSTVLIHAKYEKGHERRSILLRENEYFEFHWGHIDVGCSVIGKYKADGDKIILMDTITGDPRNINSGPITGFFRRGSILIPVTNNTIDTDSTEFFIIKE
jgi:hypothetical protein